MKIQILCRFSAKVLFETEAETVKAALEIAVVKRANLRDANLGGANLRGAYLGGAYLGGANLKDVKEDYLSVLAVAQHEVPELYKALLSGRVDGSTYKGDCACLVGTIAHARHEDYQKLGIDLRPDSNRPAEKWFLNIRKGDTPENNPVSALVKEWTEDFAKEKGIKLPVMEVVWKDA